MLLRASLAYLDRQSWPDLNALRSRELQILVDATRYEPYKEYLLILSDFVYYNWKELGGFREWNEVDGDEDEEHAEPEAGDDRVKIVVAALMAIRLSVKKALEHTPPKLAVPSVMLSIYVVGCFTWSFSPVD